MFTSFSFILKQFSAKWSSLWVSVGHNKFCYSKRDPN